MRLSLNIILVLLGVVLCTSTNGLKILGIFPYAGKSHFLNFQPITLQLAKMGHDVTVISHFPQKNPVPRYRDISLAGASNMTMDAVNVADIYSFPKRLVQYLSIVEIVNSGSKTCNYLETEVLQNFIHSKNESFDVLLVEQFDTDCYLGFVHKFNAPWIGIASHVIMPFTNDRYGGVDNPSIVPNHFLDFSDRMGFLERVENSVMYLYTKAVHRYLGQLPAEKVVRKHFGEDVPSLEVLARSSSLLLTNTHYSLSLPRPLVPNMVEIGGIHIGKKGILPKNIEKWLNESSDTEGVIYFSMGSMIKGHTFPVEKRQAFLKAFARFPRHRVLWKWETETMPDKPENVMIQKWMPQFDILCHPKVKAFISHGGMLGTTEAVHCGVPILVMPQFGDQHTNARALEASGGGVILNFQDVTEDSVVQGLQTILDHKFNKQAKELSERFRDRPLPPLETAIYWIEYVARHKGAPHMRTAAVGMPFYQYLLLDVIAFLATIVFIFAYITKKIIRAIFAKICGSGKKTESTLIKKKQR